MNKQRLVILFSLLLLIASSCVHPEPGVPPTSSIATPTTAVEPTPEIKEKHCPELLGTKEVVTDRYWLKCQVIVTGVKSEIEQVLRETELDKILKPIIQLELGQYAANDRFQGQYYEQLKQRLNRAPADPKQLRELTSILYSFTEDVAVEKVVRAINAQLYKPKAEQKSLFVFADPNYLTAPTGYSKCTSIGSLGPNVIGHGPFGQPGVANAADFTTQWAFTTLTQGAASISDVVGAESGANVLVAIFDTSPFTQEVTAPDTVTPVSIGWAQPGFTMSVIHPTLITSGLGSVVTPTVGATQHGLFSAGLIHAVASASPIRLIRVLEDNGCGDVADLGVALWGLLDELIAQNQPAVLNLSLGIYCPADCGQILIPETCPPSDKACLEEARELWFLVLPTLLAPLANTFVVAASGNDSWDEFESGAPPNEPEKPAAYDFVLGVAGSTKQDTRACYSNLAVVNDDIAAPSGDGGSAVITETQSNGTVVLQNHTCAPVADTCADPACEFGLVSTVQQTFTTTGYAYWSGTSFAAPLVSGAAAVCLNQGKTAAQVLQALRSTARPSQILPTAVDHDSLGSGILDLVSLMKDCQAK